MFDSETLSIDRVLNKEHLYGKIIQKICTKSIPKVNQNSHCMQEILLKIRYFERGLSKGLKKVNFIFLSNPIPLLVMYYMTKFDDVISRGFWVTLKITFASLC